MSPTNMPFSYCFPSLSEFRNLRAVGPTIYFQVNSGLLYFPRRSKFTRISLSSLSLIIEAAGPPLAFQIPCTLFHPLLNPGSTRLISSPKLGPFSVSHKSPVTGSNQYQSYFVYHRHSIDLGDVDLQ